MAKSNVEKFVAEFVGTFLLVLTVSCNVLAGNAVWAATSIAMVLMVGIYALGGVSGAHFNPAVTLAVALSGKMRDEDGPNDWGMAGLYMVFQILGGLCGSVTGFFLFNNSFNLAPGAGFDGTEAAAVEILYTFMLCFVVLNVACATATDGNQYYGLAIGSVIVAGGYAGGAVSGGAFNPAVALGIDLASVIQHGFGWSLAYVVFELIGAAAAALVFRVVRAEDFGGEKNGRPAKMVSEFLGTYFLVVTVGLNVLAKNSAAAYSIAASLMVMIYALWNVSGAHFNPAVTLAVLICGKRSHCLFTFTDAILYWVVQILGGLLAGLTYFAIYGATFPLGPGASHTWASAGVAETLFTAILVFVVLSVATTKTPSADMFGLAIGSCVTVGGYAVGKVSGGSLNPAVSWGLDTAHAVSPAEGVTWMNCLGYTAFELLGAILACGAFYLTRPEEFAGPEKAPLLKAK